MIKLSTKARGVLQKRSAKDNYVRITVAPGGCAGMTYDASIVSQAGSSEKIVFEEDGIRIISDDASLPYMEGLEIDYSDDLISSGFRFNNDQNDSSCGCGASFTVSGFPQFITGGESCGS